MLPCICPVIDHRGRQNVVRTSVTHSAIASCATFLFLARFDVICDLLQDRSTATWNLFVNSKSNCAVFKRVAWLLWLICQLIAVTGFSVERQNYTDCKIECH